VVESAEVCAPFCGVDGDESVVGAFLFEDDGVGVLPGVDEAWIVGCAPAEVFDAWDVGCVVIEFAHVFESEKLEGLAVASAVGKHVEEGEELWETVFAEGFEKVVCEGRAAVGGCDGGY